MRWRENSNLTYSTEKIMINAEFKLKINPECLNKITESLKNFTCVKTEVGQARHRQLRESCVCSDDCNLCNEQVLFGAELSKYIINNHNSVYILLSIISSKLIFMLTWSFSDTNIVLSEFL